jgi:hypothetical protein
MGRAEAEGVPQHTGIFFFQRHELFECSQAALRFHNLGLLHSGGRIKAGVDESA